MKTLSNYNKSEVDINKILSFIEDIL